MEDELWGSLQNLNLGSELNPLQISTEVRNKHESDNQLSLIVRPSSLLHQNPLAMKKILPRAWRLESQVTGRINDDQSIQFFFRNQNQILKVMDNGPWTFSDWILIVDRWIHRDSPEFLRSVTFWVQVFDIPNEFRNEAVIDEIGGILGQVEEIRIHEPSNDVPEEIWIRIRMNAYSRLIFVRYIQFEVSGEPILIRFEYEKLKEFCFNCGALTHEANDCDHPLPQEENNAG